MERLPLFPLNPNNKILKIPFPNSDSSALSKFHIYVSKIPPG